LEQQKLEEHFKQSRTIPGTRSLHSLVPLTLSEVTGTRKYPKQQRSYSMCAWSDWASSSEIDASPSAWSQ